MKIPPIPRGIYGTVNVSFCQYGMVGLLPVRCYSQVAETDCSEPHQEETVRTCSNTDVLKKEKQRQRKNAKERKRVKTIGDGFEMLREIIKESDLIRSAAKTRRLTKVVYEYYDCKFTLDLNCDPDLYSQVISRPHQSNSFRTKASRLDVSTSTAILVQR